MINCCNDKYAKQFKLIMFVCKTLQFYYVLQLFCIFIITVNYITINHSDEWFTNHSNDDHCMIHSCWYMMIIIIMICKPIIIMNHVNVVYCDDKCTKQLQSIMKQNCFASKYKQCKLFCMFIMTTIKHQKICCDDKYAKQLQNLTS